MNEDGLLLGRLLHCLGVIVECAGGNHPLIDRMSKVLLGRTIFFFCQNLGDFLLEFVLAVRYHKEPFARRSCVFAASTVISTLQPKHVTSVALLPLLNECHQWLKGIVLPHSALNKNLQKRFMKIRTTTCGQWRVAFCTF